MVAETHEFDIVLVEPCEASEFMALADALYEKGCDDSLVAMFKGRVRLSFCREAETLQLAVKSAMTDVRAAGYTPQKAELAGSSRPMLLWSPELEDVQVSLRKLYERAKIAGQRYWEADSDLKGHYGAASEETLVNHTAAELDYETAQEEFKQTMHAVLGLSEEEVRSVYNPEL